MPLSLFTAKGADTKSVCINNGKSSCIGDAYVRDTYARDIYTKNTFLAVNACIKSAHPDDTSKKGGSKKSACARGTCAVKYLKIYLQSFSIIEIELFDIG